MEQQDFQNHVIEKLARLTTQMESLVGNGHPGRMGLIEERMAAVEKKVWTFSGMAVAASLIIHAAIRKLGL